MTDLHPLLGRRSGRHHRPHFWRTRGAWAFAAGVLVAGKAAVLVALHFAAVKQVQR